LTDIESLQITLQVCPFDISHVQEGEIELTIMAHFMVRAFDDSVWLFGLATVSLKLGDMAARKLSSFRAAIILKNGSRFISY